jgi:hypothetical protein
MATSVAGWMVPVSRRGGAQATTSATPATLAVAMLMIAEAIKGYLPPGT